MNRTIRLRYAELDWIDDWGALTRWPDGSQWGATPHQSPHYHALAYRMGYDGDRLAYCREHELCHHLVAEAFGRRSHVLWSLAHGRKPTPMIAAAEESLAMNLQRYARANEHPFVDCCPWEQLKERFLKLVEG